MWDWPTFPTPLLKKWSFLHCIFLPPLPKINWLLMHGFISGLLFCSIDPYVYSYANIMPKIHSTLLERCSIILSIRELCLQLCSFSSRLLWQLMCLLLNQLKSWVLQILTQTTLYPKLSRVYFRLRKLEKDQIRIVSLRFGDFSLWLMGKKMYSFFFSLSSPHFLSVIFWGKEDYQKTLCTLM